MRRIPNVAMVVAGLVVLGIGVPTGAWSGDLDTRQWAETRSALFQERSIQEEADGIVQLDVPLRPDDAAAVPVLIRVKPPQPPGSFVKSLYVVIDKNPEPLAGAFHLTPDTGLAEVQT